ncbi:protein regulator of cytokinesis 1-like [Diorhabda carinulata]|uniref:protein regulator of cytokinesis 1-like n=1 Tax=Diorhabda carinulata TaxID=1163345 RepID=UPI0025A1A1CB|nr:protein regulator of cytokinesis 1-like [Diorhabda carinulata]
MDTSKVSSLEELKDLDMDFINDIGWAKVMWDSLQACLKKSFLNWVDTVLTMSQNEDDVKEWRSTFMEQFEDRCYELVTDIRELHEQVLVNIEKYLNKTQVLCKMLQADMPVIGQHKLGLYQEQFQLKRQMRELEQMVEARMSEVNQLRSKQLELCKNLGREPILIKDHPLPSLNEISDLKKHIEQLEQETFDRLEKFTTVKGELIEIINLLGYTPSTQFELAVITGEESDFKITEENMESLDLFLYNMKKELNNVKEEIYQLRTKIEQLWNMLDVDFVEREEFRKKYVGDSLNTLEALRLELKRCESLKRANIKVFVDRLRQELVDIWKLCHCSESVRYEFRFFDSDTYTEDLLELHEVQLKKWKIYAEENKDIIALLNKHHTLWDKMIELEQNATGADRYNNRGGKLLKEEKERNLLSKQIPKIEANLLDLAERYQLRHGVPFLTFGNTIESYINNLHANRENAKKLKLSARKLQKEATAINPSTSHMTSKRILTDCPSADPKKYKLTPRKVFTEPKKNPKQLQVPKILLTTLSKSKRLSVERKKRLDKIRRLSRQKEMRDSSTYIEFQNDLSNRVDLRSTMNVALDNETVVKETFKSPARQSGRTPKSVGKKSPNLPNKLTAVKSQIKLIF